MSEQHPADARAEARLKRERAARRESEDIAEATLRRLYLRQADVDLLSQVTSIANSAQEFESAFLDAMVLIRRASQWQVATTRPCRGPTCLQAAKADAAATIITALRAIAPHRIEAGRRATLKAAVTNAQ